MATTGTITCSYDCGTLLPAIPTGLLSISSACQDAASISVPCGPSSSGVTTKCRGLLLVYPSAPEKTVCPTKPDQVVPPQTSTTTTSQPLSSTGATSSSSVLSELTSPPLTVMNTASLSLHQTSTSHQALNPNSTATSYPRPVVPAKGITSGAVAGIAIGCLLIGVVLASVVFLFLRKRKTNSKRQTPPGYADRYLHGDTPPEKNVGSYPLQSVSPGGAGMGAALVGQIPPPAEDDTIIGGMSKLRDRIKNHAQSYYHCSPVSPNALHEADLRELATVTGLSTSTLMKLFLDPQTRLSTIRLFLGWVVLSHCVCQNSSQSSFLPPEVAPLVGRLNSMHATQADQTVLVSKWKQMSGALLQPLYRQHTTENDPRNGSFAQARALADAVVSNFATPGLEGDRRVKNLEETIRRAAQLSLLLFSQPSEWRLEWMPGGEVRHSHGAVHGGYFTFPALLQVTNEHGDRIQPARIFCKGEFGA